MIYPIKSPQLSRIERIGTGPRSVIAYVLLCLCAVLFVLSGFDVDVLEFWK